MNKRERENWYHTVKALSAHGLTLDECETLRRLLHARNLRCLAISSHFPPSGHRLGRGWRGEEPIETRKEARTMDKRLMNAMLSTLGESDVAVPEGYLYAGLMDRMSLGEFNGMMELFIRMGLVTREAGPTIRPTRKLLDVVAGCKAGVARG